MEQDDRPPSFSAERFTVRMPDGMRDFIAERAKANQRSMNSEIIAILEAYTTGDLVPADRLLKDPAVRKLVQEAVRGALQHAEVPATVAKKVASMPLLSVAPRKSGKKPGRG